ncbi:MAG TPA: metallophosphoesterase [Gemmatimonadales bacterium]|nr:metallophosphoesterase [Gemmatimonadales bacterium]
MSSPSWYPRILLCFFLATTVSLVAACGEGGPVEQSGPAEIILAAGNIATCGTTNDEATAAILDTLPGTIFTLGDNVSDGSFEAYTECYAPSWGRHKARTYAALGNHEYRSGTATSSFDYFGDRAGPRDLGYYSLNLGNWHIIVLNLNDVTLGESMPFAGSAQDQWLQADLAANTKTCVLALWHNPRFFSSNTIGWTSNAYVTDVWKRLYDAGVDVVLNGHQHHYERFPPMTPTGSIDEVRGIRAFNVGTGGESTEPMIAIAEHSAVRSDAFGILKLTLEAGSYSWQFVPSVPGQFSDSGTGVCN